MSSAFPGSIVESLRVPVAAIDLEGHLAFANFAFAELAGIESALPGAAFGALFAAEDRRRVDQGLTRVAQGKAGSATFEARLATPHGLRWVEVLLQPGPTEGERPANTLAILRDIEVQRDTEQALYVLTARLLALAEASPVAAMIENAEGDIEMVNEAFLRLLSVQAAPQSVMGVPADDVLARSATIDTQAVERARQAGSGRADFRLRDGRMVTLERQPVVVEGEVSGGVWSPARASASEEAASKAAAGVALVEKIGEELTVALDGLSAIATRAQQMEFDPVLVEHFHRIRRSTETAMAAIGDLVDFSEVSGQIVLNKAPFRLRQAIADLIGRVASTAEEHDCRLRVKIEQDVADGLEGDVERLQLVLKNLLENAFALLPGIEVTLRVTPEYTTEAGMQISFAIVVDVPRGVSLAPLASTAQGGLGIAVARFMVAAMGGKLAAAGHPGLDDALYGFTIEFPVHAAPAPARPTYVSLVGLSVLIVSGDSEQRVELSTLLRGWRMVPLEADNAPMAMALLERLHGEGQPAPLVILGSRLRGQDAFLLAFRIKHHDKLAPTLVMMLASEGKPGDAIACRENGISAYLRYPVNERQLNEAVVAVTGASPEPEEADTLVTRHSLREHRKGATVLLVDASRESQLRAAHVLGRQDCSVVIAEDLDKALAALDQDFYDLVLVDTSLPGLEGDDAAAKLRARITREPQKARIIATDTDHSPAFRVAKTAIGFTSTIAKPFEKEELLALVQAVRRAPVQAH